MKNTQKTSATPAPAAVVAQPDTLETVTIKPTDVGTLPAALAQSLAPPATKRVSQATPVINTQTGQPYVSLKNVQLISGRQYQIVLGLINHYDKLPNAVPAIPANGTTPEVPGIAGVSPEDRVRYNSRTYQRNEVFDAMLAMGRHSNPSWITKNPFLRTPGEPAGLIHVDRLQLDPMMGAPRPPKVKATKTAAPALTEAAPDATLAAEATADGAISIPEATPIVEKPATPVKSGRKGTAPTAKKAVATTSKKK